MHNFKLSFYFLCCIALCVISCTAKKHTNYQLTKHYVPDDPKLYDTIVQLDSAFFGAYNTCSVNLEKYASFFSEDIEFYHDHGGLMTSKQDIVTATKNNVCGKVTRVLVKGSIEVYPIRNFGAVEIGLHSFRNNQEPAGTPSTIGRFLIVWENSREGWKIKRVVSLH